MRNAGFIIVIFLGFVFSCSEKTTKGAFIETRTGVSPLKAEPNNRFLVTESGEPVFLNGETAWRIAYQLDTNEVSYYLNKRRHQKFNAIGVVAIMDVKDNGTNVYGSPPFHRSHNSGLYDPLDPVITSGYDFWDHLDYIIETAEAMNFYVILLPTWGSKVAGSWDGEDTSEIIFDDDNAYKYGRWIGNRYREEKHIIWMLGGDRSATYGQNDYRSVFRAMAEGVADGVNGEDLQDGKADYGTVLMSYHPRKKHPNSSQWFHQDSWLDFNSIQEWPEDQIASVTNDYQLEPAKPTWLFEGRYEDYNEDWKDWQIRYQAYQSVFAGGFGHTYGHERIWGFFPGWETQLDDSAAWDMQHLYNLMTSLDDKEFLNRIPKQNLIRGDCGAEERLTSNRIQATQGSDGRYAFIYSANGRDISVKMHLLAEAGLEAYWYNPRNGRWHVNGKEYNTPKAFEADIPSGPGAPDKTFDPPYAPADENDWVLVLRKPKF